MMNTKILSYLLIDKAELINLRREKEFVFSEDEETTRNKIQYISKQIISFEEIYFIKKDYMLAKQILKNVIGDGKKFDSKKFQFLFGKGSITATRSAIEDPSLRKILEIGFPEMKFADGDFYRPARVSYRRVPDSDKNKSKLAYEAQVSKYESLKKKALDNFFQKMNLNSREFNMLRRMDKQVKILTRINTQQDFVEYFNGSLLLRNNYPESKIDGAFKVTWKYALWKIFDNVFDSMEEIDILLLKIKSRI